ncbi:nectin-4 [Plectropomus leopardus]|uniref:nectin-4 n=1 Tax=Plectropomus leopardus TaxID=160734 RepID=UPI001C4DC150|nr:nectin-4 [Plectropomus leopardus]
MEVNISKKSEDLFECVADANPHANFTWTRISQSIPQSAVRVKGPTLQFLGITSDLNGLYQCSASNPYGKSHGHLYVHVNSGNCVACWVFFVILLFALVFGVVAAWYLYKAGRLQWNENDMHGERQRVPTTNSTPERAAIEVEPLGDTGGGSASVTSM